MSTKRDPVIAVIKYFEEAELSLARQALALCQQTLRRRTPFPVQKSGRRSNGRTTTPTTKTTPTARSAAAGSSAD